MTDTLVRVDVAGPGAGDIRLEALSHRYSSTSGDVQALDVIDLQIAPSEFVAIVGPSGCGKSTLLELVAGLRPASSGDVLLDGRRVVGPSARRCVVFQQSVSLMPWLTVQRNVELGLAIRKVPRAERARRAAAELARVGLSEFADHRVHELSGGMQQRCQIARALAVDPEVLLLDEPFGALDAMTRERLQGELLEIWRARRHTVLFVTHSIDEAVLLGTRVIVMSPRPGRIVLDRALQFSTSGRSAAEVRTDPAFDAACRELRAVIADDPNRAIDPTDHHDHIQETN